MKNVSIPNTNLSKTDKATSLIPYLKLAWNRRHFAMALPSEIFRSRNQDTILGNLWNLLNPAINGLIYFLIFGVILNAGSEIDNYALWLIIGLFCFKLSHNSVMQGATSITSRLGLVRSLKFPRILLPISTTVGELLAFVFELLVLVLFTLLTGEGLTFKLFALPLVIAFHSLFNLSLALVAARLNDKYRDVQQIIPFVFQMMRYLSGVMVPLSLFKDRGNDMFYNFLSANPLSHILDLYRWCLMDSTEFLTWSTFSFLTLFVTALLFMSLRYFLKGEHSYGKP